MVCTLFNIEFLYIYSVTLGSGCNDFDEIRIEVRINLAWQSLGKHVF